MSESVSLAVQISNTANDDDYNSAEIEVESVTVQMGINQDTATASVTLSGLPAYADKTHRIIVYAGWNGSTDLVYNGLISGRSGGLARRAFDLKCQCYMARLRHPWGNGEYAYTNQTDDDIVTNLIEKSGIDVSLHSIVGSGWTLATLEDLLLRDGTSDPLTGDGTADVPLSIIREIDKVALYWTATRGDGAIYRRAIAITTPYASYSDGDSGVRDIQWDDDVEGIVNKVLAKGKTIAPGVVVEDEFSDSNSLLPYPVDFNTETVSSNLIEDDASRTALQVATDYVTLYNHAPENITLTLDGDNAMQIGYTITVNSSFLGINKDYFITGVEHNISSNDFVTTVKAMALD
jgi:hypothetical protein